MSGKEVTQYITGVGFGTTQTGIKGKSVILGLQSYG